jgi:hypothetical protein
VWLELTSRLVGFVGQIKEEIGELLRLADEEAVVHETLNGGDGTAESCGCWANDGDRPEAGIEEMRWLRHDEVGLERIAVEGLGICLALGLRQSGERYSCARAAGAVVGVRNGKRVAGFVLPGLEVHGLARADAEQDCKTTGLVTLSASVG